jgi:hypothetical protein
MNNPPTLAMWLQAPQLSYLIVTTVWPYIYLPLCFILGITLMKAVMESIRSLTKKG